MSTGEVFKIINNKLNIANKLATCTCKTTCTLLTWENVIGVKFSIHFD